VPPDDPGAIPERKIVVWILLHRGIERSQTQWQVAASGYTTFDAIAAIEPFVDAENQVLKVFAPDVQDGLQTATRTQERK
jgi:hypothetical protein